MTPERWQKIDQILDVVLELDACERTKFLNRTCADDIELLSEVESLLAASEQSGSFIESPFLSAADLGDTDSISLAGQSLGPYRLLREIGCGGMGVVYLAVRADDEFKKQVAIKLVQSGPHNKDLLRRFRRERQILANLDHPNIARLFDGGTTEQGLPYLVMEYITGTPITEYCDERKLSITDRLKLFRDVCAAVQHAHQSLVIHCDLKPSNILVTLGGEVKLLDFGIAKLLDATSVALNATTGVPVMTPEYASPEQICGEPVTTASDVYSLGIVLYELLTGHYPYRFKDRSLSEIIRVICEQEPEPPSRAISRIETNNGKPQTTLSPETVSRTREGRPEKLRARLRGDLSAIVLTALRKDPQCRYSTVEQLSEDIRRHLEGQVVFARKATFAYRAGKFIRRYKTGATVALILLLILLGGIFATLRQASIARQEARDKRRTLYAAEMKLGAQAWDTTNMGRLRELIEDQLPRDGEDDLRGFEWRYLWRLDHHNGEIFRFQHDIEVWAVAYSPDGHTLATVDDAGWLALWDTSTGQQVIRIKAHEEYIWNVKFSPDGKLLATASGDATVKLWDTATWQEFATLRGHKPGRISVVAFSADGKLLVSGSDDLTAKIWDVASGQNTATIDMDGAIRNLALSPDGKKLALWYSGLRPLSFWDTTTGKRLREIKNIYGVPAMFSPDGKLLALIDGRIINLLDVATEKVTATFDGHISAIHSVAFSPDGRLLATGSIDRTTKIWDISSGGLIANIKGHEGEIFSVAFSPDGKTLATGSNDFTARLWDIATVSGFAIIKDKGRICSLAFSPDGKTIVSSLFSSLINNLWDVGSGKQLGKIEEPRISQSVAFSRDGKRLAIGYIDGTLKLLDATTYQEATSFKAHTKNISSLVFSPDGQMLVTASFDKTVKLWDAATRQLLRTIAGHDERLSAVAFSPDGELLATASHDRTEKLWDVKTGRELATIRGHVKVVLSLAFSPDGKTLATGGADGIVKLWDVGAWLERATFTGHAGHVNSVAFSPDGKRLATGSDEGLVRLWDLNTGQEVIALSGHTDVVTAVAFSPDGDTLVSASYDSTIRFWRAASREEAFAQR
ncbi:MAG TPA: protein kinase [Blastocatellia bacterium]|nr:protein kinase [Blastocatellia bacterium]